MRSWQGGLRKTQALNHALPSLGAAGLLFVHEVQRPLHEAIQHNYIQQKLHTGVTLFVCCMQTPCQMWNPLCFTSQFTEFSQCIPLTLDWPGTGVCACARGLLCKRCLFGM